jgi:excisionase family DNA binding protein
MRDLRDWYSYLERSVQDAKPPGDSRRLKTGARLPVVLPAEPSQLVPSSTPAAAARGSTRPARRKVTALELQQRLPIDLGPTRSASRVGRPPLTETREEIVRRLLDPELTLHEAAAVLALSKATLRRYTDQGKLPCRRTAGGQRRFQLSDILALLEQREAR